MSAPEAASLYPHWMLQEIFEQPETLAATLARYVDRGRFDHARFDSEACGPIFNWLAGIESRILIAASGSSRHAAMVAELIIESFSGIAVDVEYASEYSYRSERALSDVSVIVVSQSGETADTLAALRKANLAGHQTLAITNVADSTMAREATVSYPTLAGRERAIPATKSFTAQLLNLYLLSLMAALSRQTIDDAQLSTLLDKAQQLPAIVAAQLPQWQEAMSQIAGEYRDARSFLFLGRGVHYPIAREGALKLKESAYLHAEGYPSGELKHGPNALVAEGTPLVMIATVDRSDPESVLRHEKVLQLLADMREQGADIIAVANTGDYAVAALASHTVFVDGMLGPDEMPEPLLAICEVVPLQLLSYFMAIDNGIDVDHPRNLTKAVLAE